MREFVRGCMRTCLILKERAERWNRAAEIQALVAANGHGDVSEVGRYSAAHRDRLLGHEFDRAALAARGLGYERLDQVTLELLPGVR